jgi:addiction module HigA family antidote
MKLLNLIHPGEILLEDFLIPMGISPESLATDLNISVHRMNMILQGTCPINAELAIKLARRFNTTEQFWMNLQVAFDLGRLQ